MNLYREILENILLTREGEDIVLTKEHLSFRTKKGKILPKLIDTDDKKYLGLADELLVVFKNCVGFTREKLEECTSQILEKYSNNLVVAKGLEKLLFDLDIN